MLRYLEIWRIPTPLFASMVNLMVPLVFPTKFTCKSYSRFKTSKKKGYLCEVSEFEKSEGTYPPIIEACEHNGVKNHLNTIVICEE